tara:strand:+ start:5252 stop:5569 length:318 start_codon:yes stop_codon:yes gene_type:complete
MLEATDRERLAVVENDLKWVRESVDHIESEYKNGLALLNLSNKELLKGMNVHLEEHRRTPAGSPNGSTGGVSIQIGGKALVILAGILGTSGGGAVWTALGTPGVG